MIGILGWHLKSKEGIIGFLNSYVRILFTEYLQNPINIKDLSLQNKIKIKLNGFFGNLEAYIEKNIAKYIEKVSSTNILRRLNSGLNNLREKFTSRDLELIKDYIKSFVGGRVVFNPSHILVSNNGRTYELDLANKIETFEEDDQLIFYDPIWNSRIYKTSNGSYRIEPGNVKIDVYAFELSRPNFIPKAVINDPKGTYVIGLENGVLKVFHKNPEFEIWGESKLKLDDILDISVGFGNSSILARQGRDVYLVDLKFEFRRPNWFSRVFLGKRDLELKVKAKKRKLKALGKYGLILDVIGREPAVIPTRRKKFNLKGLVKYLISYLKSGYASISLAYNIKDTRKKEVELLVLLYNPKYNKTLLLAFDYTNGKYILNRNKVQFIEGFAKFMHPEYVSNVDKLDGIARSHAFSIFL